MYTWLPQRGALIAAAIILVIGVVGCGQRPAESTIPDATAVILTRLPTLQAQMTQVAPTLQGQLTQSAPTVQAIMTLVAQGVTPEGAAPLATPTAAAPGGASPTAGSSGGPLVSTPTTGASGGSTGDYDVEGTSESGFPIYGEGYPTTRVERIALGGTAAGTLTTAEAHNYLFDGSSGQTITIRVAASGGSDPRLWFIDPHGNLLADNDDGGGGASSLLTVTLPETGTFTIRIDMWVGGGYTLTVS